MDADLSLFSPTSLDLAPPGLTFQTANAAMAAMAEVISYMGDRSTGDVLFEAVCGLARHPEVLDGLHREIVVGHDNAREATR